MDRAAHGDPQLAPVQWQGRFIATRRTPAGWEFVTRTSGPKAVVIAAQTAAGAVLLVEQYRVPLGRPVVEFPAGLVGDDGEHDVLATARRELREECGYHAESLELLAAGPVSAGLTDETLYLVRASDLVQVGAGGGVAGEEAITVHAVAPAALPDFFRARQAQGVLLDVKLNLGLVALGLPPHWWPAAVASES